MKQSPFYRGFCFVWSQGDMVVSCAARSFTAVTPAIYKVKWRVENEKEWSGWACREYLVQQFEKVYGTSIKVDLEVPDIIPASEA